jgi:hypothetical protein
MNIGTGHVALLVTSSGDGGLVQPHHICNDDSLFRLRQGMDEKVFVTAPWPSLKMYRLFCATYSSVRSKDFHISGFTNFCLQTFGITP